MNMNVRRLRFEALESRRLLTAVDVPDDLTGGVEEQVLTPVNVDDASGIRGAEIRLAYDPSVVTIDEADISAGSVWSGDATVDVVATVDDTAGTIVVAVFGAQSLPATSGSLVEFRFTIQSGTSVGTMSVIDLTEVVLNEGEIELDTDPRPGPDATDGLITVSEELPQNADISGRVYADVNVNNQPDATEGLPGVTITLINTATNAQQQATTQSDGGYEFTNLAPGSYRIVQQQPKAYLDGGANEIAITLTASQNLTGQHFRELGLRPEFVYNRLFTTLVMPIGSPNWVSAITRIHDDAEAGIVNAAVTAATSTPRAEGEGPSVAAIATVTTLDHSAFSPPIDPVAPSESSPAIVAEGEGSVELMIGDSYQSDFATPRDAATPPGILVPSGRPTSSAALSGDSDDMARTRTLTHELAFANEQWRGNLASHPTLESEQAIEDQHSAGLSGTARLDELLAVDEAFSGFDRW